MTAVIFGSSILLGLGFAATLILYLRLRRELRAWLREQRQKEMVLDAEVHELKAKLQRTAPGAGSERSPLPNDPAATGCVVRSVSEEILAAKLEEPAAAPEPPSTPRICSGINISKRIQAIRMLRRGENSAHIAAALGMSRREVELLIRVHRMSVGRAAQAAGAG